jgi:hypothetical protein
MNNTQYTLLILEAYEDEVAGAAYFHSLARAYPQHSSRLIELLRKYHLTPSAQTTLEERGALDARIEATGDWRMLVQQSIKSYARYVAEFKALEAMGPAEDQPILEALTAHEVQLIEWMRAEIGF